MAAEAILGHAIAFKSGRDRTKPLAGKILAMVFEKPSTRTRLSFEVAMKQLGGDVVTLVSADSQISRGETTADTARSIVGLDVTNRVSDAVQSTPRLDSPRTSAKASAGETSASASSHTSFATWFESAASKSPKSRNRRL